MNSSCYCYYCDCYLQFSLVYWNNSSLGMSLRENFEDNATGFYMLGAILVTI